jgi:cobyric acid synthase
MLLNSAPTPNGCEIGRAQTLQAEACRISPTADMNPMLIKPSYGTAAQVVLMRKVWDQISTADLHQVEEQFPLVVDTYLRLAADYEIVLLEGAGSPTAIKLKAHDIVNMRMARAAAAACLLIGDIDRGGVFATLLGAVKLTDCEERALWRGFVISKFRGDISLLEPGVETIARRLRIPCARCGALPAGLGSRRRRLRAARKPYSCQPCLAYVCLERSPFAAHRCNAFAGLAAGALSASCASAPGGKFPPDSKLWPSSSETLHVRFTP